MFELSKTALPMDEGDVTEIKFFLPDEETVKIVYYLSVPYYNAKLYVDGKCFTDGFNDKEPYDNQTHFFFVPNQILDEETVLFFTADDSFTDGELYYSVVSYGSPDFADRDALLNEYNSRINVLKEDREEISDGVIYRHMLCSDKSSAPVHAFMFELDSKKASLYVGTPDDGYKSGGVVAKVPEMIDSAVKNGVKAVGAVNADFFDMFGDGSPSGLCVKNGKIIANADSLRPFIGIKKDGTPVLTSLAEEPEIISELDCAAAGLEMIVKDGKINEWGPLEPFSFVRHPRTAAGLTKEGTILLLVVDGRIPNYSNGATLVDLAEIMIKNGADRAVNLDGGGSSVVYTKKGDEFILRSNPADLIRPLDKLIRDEFNCLIITEK